MPNCLSWDAKSDIDLQGTGGTLLRVLVCTQVSLLKNIRHFLKKFGREIIGFGHFC